MVRYISQANDLPFMWLFIHEQPAAAVVLLQWMSTLCAAPTLAMADVVSAMPAGARRSYTDFQTFTTPGLAPLPPPSVSGASTPSKSAASPKKQRAVQPEGTQAASGAVGAVATGTRPRVHGSMLAMTLPRNARTGSFVSLPLTAAGPASATPLASSPTISPTSVEAMSAAVYDRSVDTVAKAVSRAVLRAAACRSRARCEQRVRPELVVYVSSLQLQWVIRRRFVASLRQQEVHSRQREMSWGL
jgi:hypothetical protein